MLPDQAHSIGIKGIAMRCRHVGLILDSDGLVVFCILNTRWASDAFQLLKRRVVYGHCDNAVQQQQLMQMRYRKVPFVSKHS